jgi:hypothetical protein
MMKMSSRTRRIAPTIVPMTIPAMAPSERLRSVGAGGWVVGTIRGEVLIPVNPFAAKMLFVRCVVNVKISYKFLLIS